MKPKVWITLAVVLCIVAIAIPSYVKARSTRSAHPCANNLRIIDGAKEFWAYTNHVTNLEAEVDEADVLPYIKGHSVRHCNWTGTNAYIIGRLGEEPRCPVHGTITDFRKPWTEKVHELWHGL